MEKTMGGEFFDTFYLKKCQISQLQILLPNEQIAPDIVVYTVKTVTCIIAFRFRTFF